jgi:hypothetical protein
MKKTLIVGTSKIVLFLFVLFDYVTPLKAQVTAIDEIKQELAKQISTKALQALVLVESFENGMENIFKETIPTYIHGWDFRSSNFVAAGVGSGAGLWGGIFAMRQMNNMGWDFWNRTLRTAVSRAEGFRGVGQGIGLAMTRGSQEVSSGAGVALTLGTIAFFYSSQVSRSQDELVVAFEGFDEGVETVIDFANQFFDLDPVAKERIRTTIKKLKVADLLEQTRVGVGKEKVGDHFDVREILYASRAIPSERIEAMERILTRIHKETLMEQVRNLQSQETSKMDIETPWRDLNSKVVSGLESWARLLKMGLDYERGLYKGLLESERKFSSEEILKKVESKYALMTSTLIELEDLLNERKLLGGE